MGGGQPPLSINLKEMAMTFNAANWNCIAQGPLGNVYTYHTSDIVVTPGLASSSSAVSVPYFNSDVATGLAVNDRIFLSQTGSGAVSQLLQVMITAIKNSGVSLIFNA